MMMIHGVVVASMPSCTGVVIGKDDHATSYEQQLMKKYNIEYYEASHPVPDLRRSAKLHIDYYML